MFIVAFNSVYIKDQSDKWKKKKENQDDFFHWNKILLKFKSWIKKKIGFRQRKALRL